LRWVLFFALKGMAFRGPCRAGPDRGRTWRALPFRKRPDVARPCPPPATRRPTWFHKSCCPFIANRPPRKDGLDKSKGFVSATRRLTCNLESCRPFSTIRLHREDRLGKCKGCAICPPPYPRIP
jgi:hypothetical protein